MDRKEFLKKSLLVSLTGMSLPSVVEAGMSSTKPSTYDRLIENVGFNHLPNQEQKTMNTVLHKANSRGNADHGWLNSNHTFSFANYHNPERMHFGALRVLNDDRVAGGKGFGTHPHDNMEIVSIPLEGDLEHKDSMGNVATIRQGDVQVMSAGTGVYHSEYNPNKDKEVKFLQIWVFPNQKNVEPRYDKISTLEIEKKNEFYQVLSPNKKDQGVWVNQNAWFHLGDFSKSTSTQYTMRDKTNGLYVFVLEGEVKVGNQELERRDGFGIWDIEEVGFTVSPNSKILLMEVPMRLS